MSSNPAAVTAENVARPAIRAFAAAQRVCCRVAEFIDRRYYLLLAAVSIVYFAATIYRASRLLFWFDEIVTIYVAELPDLASIWHVIVLGVDGELPLLHILTRLSMDIFGRDPVGARMPEIVAFWLFCLCLFRFVSLRTNAFAGLISMVFPMITEAYWYSYDARAHALTLCASGIALVCWQAAAARTYRRLVPLLGLSSCLGGSLLLHPYSVLIFLPLVAGEVSRFMTRRRPDWPLWVAIAIFAPLCLIDLPVLQASQGFHNFFPAFFSVLVMSYPVLFSSSIAVLFFAVTAICVSELSPNFNPAASCRSVLSSRGDVPVYEIVALSTAIALPVFLFLIARVTASLMLPRYAMSCVFGVSALLGLALALRPVTGVLVLALVALLFGYSLRNYRAGVFLTEPMIHEQLSTSRSDFAKRYRLFTNTSNENLPVVLMNSLDFASTFYYAPPAILPRLVFAYEDDLEVNAFLYARLIECCGAPGAVVKLPEFVRQHPRFLAFGVEGHGKEVERFKQQGASVSVQSLANGMWLFLVDYNASSTPPPPSNPEAVPQAPLDTTHSPSTR